jgi:hypothetical protein
MTREKAVWFVPCLLALHNAEEAWLFPEYLPRVRGHAPLLMKSFADAINPNQLRVALLVVTVVPLLVSLWSWRRPQSRFAFWCVMLIQATVFLNVFAHLSSALTIFHGFGPGLFTALAINLPFSIFLFLRARQERWLSGREMFWLIPGAIIVHGPGLLGAFALAKAF